MLNLIINVYDIVNMKNICNYDVLSFFWFRLRLYNLVFFYSVNRVLNKSYQLTIIVKNGIYFLDVVVFDLNIQF
jgi:hypothetical protein